MSTLIIGSDECKISDIIDTLEKSPVHGQLDQKLPRIALALGLDNDQNRLKRDIRDGDTGIGLLPGVLIKWRGADPENATLSRFMDVLVKQGLKDLANFLEKKFISKNAETVDPAAKADGDINTNAGAQGKGDPMAEIEKQKVYIDKNISGLQAGLTYSTTLAAMFQSAGVLVATDVTALNSKANPDDQAMDLINLIKKRLNPKEPELYKTVIEIFEKQCQNTVVYILEQLYQQ